MYSLDDATPFAKHLPPLEDEEPIEETVDCSLIAITLEAVEAVAHLFTQHFLDRLPDEELMEWYANTGHVHENLFFPHELKAILLVAGKVARDGLKEGRYDGAIAAIPIDTRY